MALARRVGTSCSAGPFVGRTDALHCFVVAVTPLQQLIIAIDYLEQKLRKPLEVRNFANLASLQCFTLV
jgi:hypothetical protein